jgi:leader peptidase (prepilin peptidase) / N-methyltransferase
MGPDQVLIAVLATPFALVIGSFMTVVADRVPEGRSVVAPRSRCPRCGTQILARDNIPVLSWIILRGKCRACGERISVVYPLLEISTAALIVGALLVQDDVWIGIGFAVLLALMPAISVIDLRHRIIPNKIVYPALVAFPVYFAIAEVAGAPIDLVRMVLGFALYGGGLLVVALISRGMGMGDVKLAALIGLVLGTTGLGVVGVAAGSGILLGGIAAMIALLVGASRKQALPYGPFLAAGAAIAVFAGPAIVDWYVGFIR